MSLQADGFTTPINNWWNQFEVDEYASYIIAGKLRLLKEELKKWNNLVFVDIRVQKYDLLGNIFLFDLKEESTGLSSVEVDLRKAAQLDLAKVILTEEISRRQNSGTLWLKVVIETRLFFSSQDGQFSS